MIGSLEGEVAQLQGEVKRLQTRANELVGHLDWLGWDSDGVAEARQEIRQLQAIVAKVVPQTYGEAILVYPWIQCEPHEWDNRTTPENTEWLSSRIGTGLVGLYVPEGYAKTGHCSDGAVVCCQEKDFRRFCAGICTDELGYVVTPDGLVPLVEYKSRMNANPSATSADT
jgi:hypothetical protein